MSVLNSAFPDITKGLLYVRQGHRVLDRDYQVAYDDYDWNIAVRRAQEAAEYAAKAVYWLNERAPDWEHSLDIPMELLEGIPVVLINQEQDPRESVYAFGRRTPSDSKLGFEI